jgi:transcriptional regulator with XRE-family HTH domain
VNSQSSIARELREKSYRDAFVASQLRIALPLQCRALRESRGWTQPKLAEAAHMTQPRISEIERPGERRLNLETLLRLASAFDVALEVRFVPFTQFVDDDDCVDLDNFSVLPFDEDMERLGQMEEQMKSVLIMRPRERSRGIAAALCGTDKTQPQSQLQSEFTGLEQADSSMAQVREGKSAESEIERTEIETFSGIAC